MTLLSQVSTSYPRVPRDSFCPDTGVFSYLLSGYGQFILPASFLPLHGYWSLHFDLCPSHFHTCSGILFRIIPALFLSFRIYCIFCLKGKSGLSLLISFPSRQAYNPAYSGTSRIHYPVHFFQNAGTGPLLSYQYLLPRLYRTGLWSCGSVYADNLFSGFVFFHGTWQLSFSAAHNCGFLLHISTVYAALSPAFFHFFWRILLFQAQSLMKTLPSPASHNQSPVFWHCCNLHLLLGFRSCILHTADLQNTFRTAPYWLSLISGSSFLQAPCVFSWRSILIWEAGSAYLLPEYFRWLHLLCSCFWSDVLTWNVEIQPWDHGKNSYMLSPNEAKHLPVPANLLLSEMNTPFYTWLVYFLTVFSSFYTPGSCH